MSTIDGDIICSDFHDLHGAGGAVREGIAQFLLRIDLDKIAPHLFLSFRVEKDKGKKEEKHAKRDEREN